LHQELYFFEGTPLARMKLLRKENAILFGKYTIEEVIFYGV